MEIVHARQAKSQRVERAMDGEDVFIARSGAPMATLVPVRQSNQPRQAGQWRGTVWIAADFDELPEAIAAAFEIGSA